MIYKIVKTIPFFSLIVIFLYLGSCIYSPQKTKEIIIKNIIVEKTDPNKIVINGKDLAKTALNNSSVKLNQTAQYHTFTLHKLPTLATRSSIAYSDINLILDDYTYNDLKNKDFFLILSNTSNDTNTKVNINSLTLNTIAMPDDDISNITKQETLLTLQNTGSIDTFVNNYTDFDTARKGITKRSMMFLQALPNKNIKYKKTQTTLFKKIHTTIEEKKINILIWIEDNILQTNKVSNRINKLIDNFFLTNDENGPPIYEMLYIFNGNKHFWGRHSANNVAPAGSALHIGFGNLSNNQDYNIPGFIAPFQFFKDKIGNETKEKIIEPTMYLTADFLTSIEEYKLHSTFLHELQHISHLYNRNISQYPDNLNKQTYMGKSWFIEFTAIITEYVFLYTILQKLNKENIFDYTLRKKGIRRGFIQFNHNLYQYPLFSSKLSSKIYDLLQIFSVYILTNYGADVVSNLMNNNTQQDFKINDEALFDAISQNTHNDTFYQDYKKTNIPQSFDDIVNDFYVAHLLSEVPFPFSSNPSDDWINSGPVKMYVYSDNDLSRAEIINGGTEAAAIVSDLPIKNSKLKNILGNNDKFVTFNLAFSPYPYLSTYSRDKTYVTFAENDTEIDFSNFWLKGAGPIFSSKYTIHSNQKRSEYLQKGSGVYLYLGGKSAKNQNASSISFTKPSITELQDGADIKLTLNIQLPKGTSTTLVIME